MATMTASTMTRQELDAALLDPKYKTPWLVGEAATEHGVTWHRVKRACERLVSEGRLIRDDRYGHTFYVLATARRRARRKG